MFIRETSLTLRLLLLFLAFASFGPRALAAQVSAPEATTISAAREIDALLARDWEKNGLKPNPPASDEILVRRLYLDVAGRIPTRREAEEFLNSTAPDKRGRLIDQLLAGDGYAQNFFNYWADILRAQSRQTGGEVPREAYLNYLQESLRSNKHYDDFVRELVGAQGKAWNNGAIGYYLRDAGMPLDNFAITARIFLGTRIECAQCHDHPFDKWTQKEFFQMAAFTYPIETFDHYDGVLASTYKLIQDRDTQARKELKSADEATRKKALEELTARRKNVDKAFSALRQPYRNTDVGLRETKVLSLPHDYQYPDAKPNSLVTRTTMMGQPVKGQSAADALQGYARWMASPENPRFTTVIANRLWKKVFGAGLIEPVDGLKDDTAAVNPELMTRLEKLMAGLHYDMKAYLRVLLNTQAYQRTASPEELEAGAAWHFTGPLLRRMTPEQVWDSFVALINPTPDMPDKPRSHLEEQHMLSAKKAADALEMLTPEELLKALDVIAVKYAEEKDQANALQAQLDAALAKKDTAASKDLTVRFYRLRFAAGEAASDLIFAPGLQRLAARHGAPLPAGGLVGVSAMAPGETRFKFTILDKIKIPGYEPRQTEAEMRAEREQEEKALLAEAASHGIPENERSAFVQSRQKVAREWLRAAELETPAPRGHYLREFGQSDRELVENANLDASMPQALALMNGSLIPQVLDRHSPLMLSLRKTPDASKAEVIYKTLLARGPTAHEKEAWQKIRAKGLTNVEHLIYALLNTQQFIFIQ